MPRSFTLYKQLDQMDCGPSCLRMIAKHYGKHFSLQYLRNKAHITREGVSMLGLSEAAEGIGFRTMGVKINFEKLIQDATLPCIVHWYQRHFVVVYKISKKEVYVADPAQGLMRYTFEEFKKGWLSTNSRGQEQGITLLLEPTPDFYETDPEEIGKQNSFSYLFSYLKLHKRLIIQLIIGLLVGSIVQLIFPFLTQSIVDVGIQTQNVNFIYLMLAGQMTLFIGRASVDFIRRWILLYLGTRINISIISDFLNKLFKLPLSFFEGKMIGDILRRIDDHSRIERFISSSSLNVLFSFFNLIVFGVVLALYSLPIMIVFVGMSSLYVVYVLMFMKRRAELDYKRFQETADNQNSLIQSIQGMNEIKINNCETLKRWEWEQIQAKIFKVSMASTKLQQYQDAGSLLINETKNMVITVMAALAVINEEMTLGMMLAIQYIIGQLNMPVNEFINFAKDWQDARISLDRISEIQSLEDEEQEIKDNFQNINLFPQSKSLSIEGLSFHYEGPQSPKVLDNIDLIIPEGRITAIVGASGSGKTTLMKLLLKFYKPTEGKITLGGNDLKFVNGGYWRQHCGAVMQDGYIFSDTIAYNITLGSAELDNGKLTHAVNTANIRNFIESLPLGYNTKVGLNGVGLSQGQKQRLLIARAAYRNPEFIFFDEATSALDANNERVIMENLNNFFKGRTVLIIAHRLSTVKNADQIVVLDKGRIVEIGTHLELTLRKGEYYHLVRNQLELGN